MTHLLGYHSHSKCDELDDLLRVLHVLDGKPAPDHRSGMAEQLRAAGLGYCSRQGKAANEYLAVRTFKNGNGHVTFLRPDLVERMNKIIAKHYPGALPAPKGDPK